MKLINWIWFAGAIASAAMLGIADAKARNIQPIEALWLALLWVTETRCRSERINRLIKPVVQVFPRPVLRPRAALQQDACGAYTLLIGVKSRRLDALLQGGRSIVKEAPRHYDCTVGRQKLFRFVVLNRPHALL